jgi:LCP family protein required for cell wall assembly
VRETTAATGHGTRGVVRVTRVAVAMMSLIVLGATGYGWAQVKNLTAGLTTADVIDPAAQLPAGEQNLLIVGLDTRTDAQGNPLPADVLRQLHAGSTNDGGDTTDTMIVIHIPAGGGQATAISIPRDSYVQLADGFGQHKINAAYTYGEVAAQNQLRAHGVTGPQLATESDQAGAKTAIQTVQQFTGLTINHYAAVNLAGFYSISQAVGGVAVCLKAPVHDSYSGANFPAGPQTVSGSAALAFVRQRYGLPNGDLDRIKRQQTFIASMAKTVLSGGTLTDSTKLSNLITAVTNTVVLDKDFDITSFAQQFQGISAGDLHFVTIPIANITLHTPHDGDAVEVDPQQVQAFIQQQVNDHNSTSATSPSPVANSDVTVDVYNANGTTGLAGKVLTTLAAQGFTTGQAFTATNRNTTVINYGFGEEAAARSVASVLGGGIRVVADSTMAAGHVRVYLGKDYAGPDTQRITAPAAYHLDAPPAKQPPPPTDSLAAQGVACID